LDLIWSAMPSLGKSSVDRYVPLALAEYAIDFASRIVRINASSVLMSGFGAPARTATPMLDFARSTRLPGATQPC
jgi:hypothetical protein